MIAPPGGIVSAGLYDYSMDCHSYLHYRNYNILHSLVNIHNIGNKYSTRQRHKY